MARVPDMNEFHSCGWVEDFSFEHRRQGHWVAKVLAQAGSVLTCIPCLVCKLSLSSWQVVPPLVVICCCGMAMLVMTGSTAAALLLLLLPVMLESGTGSRCGGEFLQSRKCTHRSGGSSSGAGTTEKAFKSSHAVRHGKSVSDVCRDCQFKDGSSL